MVLNVVCPFCLLITARVNYLSTGALWIGASDLGGEGGFRWTDGSPFNYFNWDSGMNYTHLFNQYSSNNNNNKDTDFVFTLTLMCVRTAYSILSPVLGKKHHRLATRVGFRCFCSKLKIPFLMSYSLTIIYSYTLPRSKTWCNYLLWLIC